VTLSAFKRIYRAKIGRTNLFQLTFNFCIKNRLQALSFKRPIIAIVRMGCYFQKHDAIAEFNVDSKAECGHSVSVNPDRLGFFTERRRLSEWRSVGPAVDKNMIKD